MTSKEQRSAKRQRIAPATRSSKKSEPDSSSEVDASGDAEAEVKPSEETTGCGGEASVKSSTDELDAALISSKSAVTTLAEAERLVTAYMRRENRPYNAADIGRNLHNRIAKTLLGKTLTVLVSNGVLDDRGTGKVFLAKQPEFADDGGDDVKERAAKQAAEEARIEVLLKEKAAMEEEVRALTSELTRIKAEPTDSALIAEEQRLAEEISTMEQQLARIRKAISVSKISEEDVAKVDADLKRMQAARKRFAKLFKEISETLCFDCFGKRRDELQGWLEELGCDLTDS
ncbi:hypothetical protein PYCC9005_002999 [Savitreella phatthalungensis]